jgi:hypothetical protein
MLVRLSRTTLCGIVLAVSSVVLVAGCGGGGKKAATTTPSSSTSSVTAMGPRPSVTKAAIRQAWETFFDGSTTTAKRISLLQNGGQFAKTIAEVDASPLAKGVKSTVTSVTLDGPTTATVTFTVLLSGTPVLQGVKGTAVLVDGAWKVGVASFCQFAALEATAPKGCPAAAK